MATFNPGALFAVFPEALADIRANEPLPPAPEMTMAEIGASLTSAQSDLAALNADVQKYPGVIRAVDRVLAALQGMGYAWPTKWRAFLSMAPGGLAAATKYLPEAASAINMLQPAPQPIDETQYHGR